MKQLVLLFTAALVACSPNPEVARWEQRAENVTIVRDDWGIPHIYGKTDADAVFGLMYAQAEDDFNRVETNYMNAMGRLAEAEGEAEMWRDLRMKLFIDPDSMKALYDRSPEWLKEPVTLFERAAAMVENVLATHEQELLSDDLIKELDEICSAADKELS